MQRVSMGHSVSVSNSRNSSKALPSGVGYFLNVHEGPQSISKAVPDAHMAMQPGMITSIEPGVYRPGQWGVRIENLVLVEPREVPGAEKEMLGFETLTGKVSQRNECFLVPGPMLPHVALHLSVPTAVVMFVTEAAEDLGRSVPLLGRGVLVVNQDLVDDRLNRSQKRSESIPGWREGVRLSLLENLADSDSRMLEFAGDLADGLTIAPRPSNSSVVVHRKHVLDPP